MLSHPDWLCIIHAHSQSICILLKQPYSEHIFNNDFLVFEKPMILLNPNQRNWKGLGTLFEIGIELKGNEFSNLKNCIEKALETPLNKELFRLFYSNTFCQKFTN